ncbi:phosphatidylglycerophosphatase A [Roseateles sp.]|uniref:phosphatidylglycerophosphatase A family protein n=1 Tax=Roseateles sp. TaxID=1971397 RepID=UPI003964822A
MTAPRRATAVFMWPHPAHWIALGFGSGLSPKAPGTVGTLWAWLAFWALGLIFPSWGDREWLLCITASTLVGWWACTRCAQHLGIGDPGAIVWDEVVAFWLVLWLAAPMGFVGQLVAFGLFRFFDAAKPGPVAWADRLFKLQPGEPIGWRQGFGILLDDFVAAGCTLAVIAVYRFALA